MVGFVGLYFVALTGVPTDGSRSGTREGGEAP
jgi:hypothetical protein